MAMEANAETTGSAQHTEGLAVPAVSKAILENVANRANTWQGGQTGSWNWTYSASTATQVPTATVPSAAVPSVPFLYSALGQCMGDVVAVEIPDYDPSSSAVHLRQRLQPRLVLEALGRLNERNGSLPRDIRKAIKADHPELEASLGGLPIVLRKLERASQVQRTPGGTYKAALAGKVTEIPAEMLHKYFQRLFQISDTGKATGTFSGEVAPKDLHTLLKMSGFCLTGAQLQEIAAAMTHTGRGTIDYVAFNPKLVSIVKTSAGGTDVEGCSRKGFTEMAGLDDWAAFEAALDAMKIDDGEDV